MIVTAYSIVYIDAPECPLQENIYIYLSIKVKNNRKKSIISDHRRPPFYIFKYS